ncbi:dihydrolipoamide acetyltransferase [Globisporangium polare]
MEQIMQMQDDIHKLKKMMDSVFEKIESHSPDSAYDAADAYADKDRIVEMLNRLSSRMADADMSNLTATPTKDATPEDIAELKQTINNTEAERQSIYRRAGASLKGVL